MTLTSCKLPLDTSPDAFGKLTDSSGLIGDGQALPRNLERDGYLFLRGALDRDEVIAARAKCLKRLEESGALEPGTDPAEGIAKIGPSSYFRPELARDNASLLSVLYDGPMMAIFESLFGAPVRHYDFTWMRSVGPGAGTAPHADVVYMGRGTHELFTAWTPLGDIPISMGGLIILENSHRRTDVTGEYLKQDVDTYCAGGPGEKAVTSGTMHWEHWQKPGEPWDGALSHDPPALRETLGGRWLTADYEMGDVLIFTMRTVHASLDNGSDRIRLSSDTRYQPASAPIDDRWIKTNDGGEPIAHGLAAKRGRIC